MKIADIRDLANLLDEEDWLIDFDDADKDQFVGVIGQMFKDSKGEGLNALRAFFSLVSESDEFAAEYDWEPQEISDLFKEIYWGCARNPEEVIRDYYQVDEKGALTELAAGLLGNCFYWEGHIRAHRPDLHVQIFRGRSYLFKGDRVANLVN